MAKLQNGISEDIFDLEIEKQVIGELLVNKECQLESIPILTEEDFYDVDYKKIFRVIQHLFEIRERIDLVTVSQHSRKLGIKIDPVKMAASTSGIATTARNQSHVLYLNELRIRRTAVPLFYGFINEFRDLTTDVIQLIEKSSKEISLLLSRFDNGKIITFNEAYSQAAKDIQNVNSEILLSLFNIKAVNRFVIGALAGDITIISGRPGAGKTSYMMQELEYISQFVPTGLITIEMTILQLMYREICAMTQIPMEKLITKKGLTSQEIAMVEALESRVKKSKLYLAEKPRNLSDVKINLLKMIEYHGVKVWSVDYLQLIKHFGRYGSKNEDVAEITAELKAIAKSTNTHGIILSQMSRDQDKGQNARKPRLSDLRDSGAIEQDATNVIFVYNPYAQGVEFGPNGESLKGKSMLVIAKSRNGKLGDIILDFDSANFKFIEQTPIDPQEEIPY